MQRRTLTRFETPPGLAPIGFNAEPSGYRLAARRFIAISLITMSMLAGIGIVRHIARDPVELAGPSRRLCQDYWRAGDEFVGNTPNQAHACLAMRSSRP